MKWQTKCVLFLDDRRTIVCKIKTRCGDIMSTFFSTLFLGLIAAVIGATIQQRTWQHRSLMELKEKEYTEARKTVEDFSVALELRLSAQQTYTRLVLRDEVTQTDVDAYKKATAVWMGSFSGIKSRIYHSFGRTSVIDFEESIQRSMQYASAVLSLARHPGLDKLCTRDKTLFLGSERKLSIIQHDVYKFLNELNDRISLGDIGRTKAINNLNENDASMISRVYLVRRLLGIEGNIRRTYW